ncbi:unnamed protein product [Mytilus edulis]|uniref:PiggyBac transposable element-derived protein domain-containing protein n=1 Tax=Mytilus edulis TaxID=6550 RepID=A0A8S3T6R5_MYTED|nr:unnamed protein product [Mytilus edulis]
MNEIIWSEANQDVNVRQFNESTGPQVLLNADVSELDCFNTFFTTEMISKLVQETNLNARRKQQLAGRNDTNWTETDFAEMSAYLGILILMGIIQVPDYKLLWSTNKFLANGGVKEVMPVKRYEKLTQYLHVNEPEADSTDKLARIRPILDSVLERCRVANKPRQNQSIDEAMIPYKGRFSAKQYVPSKPVKWGIKLIFSGYCHEFDVYLGKGSNPNNGKSLSYHVITKLSEELKGKFHHVYFDSFFTSIPLALNLLENGIYMCGTIRKNRKQFPEELKNLPIRLEQGQYVGRQCQNLVAVVWMDKKHVSLLSTNQSIDQSDITERRQKDGTMKHITRPRIITNYQANFRGVDICDQLRSKYPVGRSSKKWWKFLFNFLTNICIINGFVLYDHFNQVEKKKKRYTQLDFRINLVSHLINGYSYTKKKTPALVVYPMNMSNPNLHRHTRLKRKKSTCKFCTKHGEKKRKETIHGCIKCDKHLCCFECHRRFHSVIGVVVTEE